MNSIHAEGELESLLKNNLDETAFQWLTSKIDSVISSESARDLYLTYSLLANKVGQGTKLELDLKDDKLRSYLEWQKADALQMARIYLLIKVLKAKPDYFEPKVANLIQVADTGELVTFLKFLILLPNAERYKHTAVEALRTNIATVFEAISMNNPYPAAYFNDQQWNQMYLKAAFMQFDLSQILDVDKRANKDLARIISDYAHERWAASRDIDPLFWRPVSQFIDPYLLDDMKKLLESDKVEENKVGALCCYNSSNREAKELVKNYTQLYDQVRDGEITWDNVIN
ncbi:EboA domain-containing protein [Pseudozobellia thermophila]|uniref:Uncharacterized protein n=1 Tax=Pseudozobellia thermophila TaxID=192903 RepID=A0A1M6GS00_9FLAO|nr:EboA domain-containing protein [Pseudozobellia thermophila]SHJ12721.1 hypothetical protein SAMN04488513_102921 [Pseudozobellia thermophila]